MSKHTPGPWRTGHTTTAYEVSRRKIVVVESGDPICEVYGVEDEASVANAKLIAAAPEMLGVLRLVELWMLAGQPGPHSDSEVLKCVRDAIGKATGND